MPGARRRSRSLRTVASSYLGAILLLVTLNFFLPRALPGKPLAALRNPRSATYVGDDARRDAVVAYYGLDKSLPTQFATYLQGLVRGDLGTSISQNVAVSDLVRARLPWTLLLGGASLLLATAVGLLAGIQSGWRRGRGGGGPMFSFIVAVDNIPVFFLASSVVYLGAVRLGWFPLSGARTAFSQSWGLGRQIVDVAHHLVLPAGVMALQFAGFQYLVMRAGMVAELGSDHLLFGRARGMPDRVLKYRYAARNALLPTVRVLALQAGFALTASVFVEAVFAYPGLGRLMFEAIGNRDYPTMQGVFLVLAVVVLTANMVADLASRRLDPRTAA